MNALRRQIQSSLTVEPRSGGFSASMTVDPKLMVLPDHFRHFPILPGMCMVQAILLAGAVSRGAPDLHLRLLKNAKMMQPILPGDRLVIDADVTDGPEADLIIKARLLVDQDCRAEFSLIARPAGVNS